MSHDDYALPDGSRPVLNAPGYRICDGGLAWTCRSNRGTTDASWRPLKPRNPNRDGHIPICLSLGGGKYRKTFVHTLVLEAFVGPRPPGLQCCHNDGNPANNFVSNLRWGTQESNAADSIKHGVQVRGIRHGMAKLDEQKVVNIFRLYQEGFSSREIAKIQMISNTNVKYVLRRKIWKHVHVEFEVNVRRGTPRGKLHGAAKLTDESIVDIFRLASEGLSHEKIAKIHGVSRPNISHIINRDTWAHVVI